MPRPACVAPSLGTRRCGEGGELIRNLAQRLKRDAPGVSKRILEGLDEILTVSRLGLPAELRRSLAYRETARMTLKPWLIEAALARLGEKLSPADQRTIVKAAHIPHKVRWPDWWSEDP
jgi:hypothetical protein